MRFFVGLDHAFDARHIPRAFISARTLQRRKSGFVANEWILDSSAFTTILTHGGYPEPVEAYARLIRRFAGCGTLLAAVAQDFMCEPFMLAKTGLAIADHQAMTIARYDELVGFEPGVYIMPVLQGYHPADYVAHLEQYGARLPLEAWVGVGSICKRNGSWCAVRDVLEAILAARPDLRLHAFGIKTTSLAYAAVRDRLHSADSMAWSFAARQQGRDNHNWREAARFGARIESQKPQLALWL